MSALCNLNNLHILMRQNLKELSKALNIVSEKISMELSLLEKQSYL